MKCYYHPDKDAVGTCSQCNKAVCRDCIEDAGGVMLCKDCMIVAMQIVATEKEAIVKEAKRSIMWSWIITAAISLICILMFSEEKKVYAIKYIFVPLIAYATWSTYWGWKVVWPKWVESWQRTGCFIIATPLTWIFFICLFFYIPFLGAYTYGVLGGGICPYLKYRRIAKGEV